MVVFDLCGTLVHKNTTFDFVLFITKKNRMYLRYSIAKLFCSTIGKALYLLLKPFGFSLRKTFVYFLKGFTKDELRNSSMLYAEHVLVNYPNPHALDYLKYMQLNNENVQIASASIEPVVSAFGEILGANKVISTDLCYSNGKCTGLIDALRDTKGRKEMFISSDLAELKFVFTDNMDDYNLCSNASDVYIYSKKKNLKKWDSIAKLYLSHVNVKFVNLD